MMVIEVAERCLQATVPAVQDVVRCNGDGLGCFCLGLGRGPGGVVVVGVVVGFCE